MTPSRSTDSTVRYTTFPTPLGDMLAAERRGRIVRLEFMGRKNAATVLKRSPESKSMGVMKGSTPALNRARKQMKAYFDGKLRKFDLPLEFEGTDFQRKVWNRLKGIPHGATTNYGDIARKAGRPKAARAAGAAIGSNPIVVAVPCHRVVGKSGALTGYGGGLWRKKWLLKHEGALN
jgi:AraC family transcriptional regulator of adaptative response/methylated-DNA-[protein]-cysteine methyltransferase